MDLARDQRVEAFLNHYQSKVQSHPNLYVSSNNQINVILPSSLLEYANAAAGHTGFGSGARARGIRQQVVNSLEAIQDIFASTENLATFLESSECNAEAYVRSVRMRHLGVIESNPLLVKTDNRSADKYFKVLHEKYNINKLATHFSRATVINARQSLTINEFELRFGLPNSLFNA